MTFLNTEIRLKEHYRDKLPSRLVMQDAELMALFRYPQRLSFVMLEGAHSDTELYPPGRTVSRIVLDFLLHDTPATPLQAEPHAVPNAVAESRQS